MRLHLKPKNPDMTPVQSRKVEVFALAFFVPVIVVLFTLLIIARL
jgi:hypothetical protein